MRGLHFSTSDPYNKGTVRPLKSGLRSGLPNILVSLDRTLETAFEGMVHGGRDNHGLLLTPSTPFLMTKIPRLVQSYGSFHKPNDGKDALLRGFGGRS